MPWQSPSPHARIDGIEAMTEHRDPYAVLGIEPTADLRAVRTAYRSLARRFHPDIPGGSAMHMTALNAAWSILGDPIARRAWDRRHQQQAAAASAATTWSHPPTRPDDTVVDFGRYEGWSIDALARHDPDYVDWLSRTPNGRRYQAAIEAARQTDSPVRAPADPRRRDRGGLLTRR
jgi:curved DNA-binding protein CbpA